MQKTLLTIALAIGMLLTSSLASPQQQIGKKGYRIDVSSNKDLKGCCGRVIRFISPSGKVIKKVSNVLNKQGYVYTVSPIGDYVIKTDEMEGKNNSATNVRLSLMDASAKTVWAKTLDVDYLNKSEDEPMSYFIVICGDGGRFVFTRIRGYNDHPGSAYNEIIVFDKKGTELARVEHLPQILDGFHISIAPDGKLVAAELQGDKLFFLDVETSRTKIVNNKGLLWRASGDPINDRKVYFTLYEYPNTRVMQFDEIPDNLSVIYGE